MADQHSNFAFTNVATAPSPANSGTSLVVTTGDGALFPTAPFNATVWTSSANPLKTNAEIVRVTAVTSDTLTITRAQESSTARNILAGDLIAATITVKTLTDIENTLADKTLLTAKGSIFAATAASTPTGLTVGANGKGLIADSTQATGLNWLSSNSAQRIGTLTILGHSWNAGANLSATGTPNYENQGFVGRLCGMLGIHENNTQDLAIAGSYATLGKNFSFVGNPSWFSGWSGILNYIIPNNSPLYADPSTSPLTNPGIPNPTAYYYAYHINDMGYWGTLTTATNYAMVENAWKHALRVAISRARAGNLWSAYKDTTNTTVWPTTASLPYGYLTFSGGTDTTNQPYHTGVAYRKLTTNGNTVTLTLPFEIPANFTVAMCFIGNSSGWGKTSTAMNNTDASTAITVTTTDFQTGDVIQNKTTGSTELMQVTAGGGTTAITVSRGFNSTTKATHSVNDEFQKAINANVTWSTSGSNTNISGASALQLGAQGMGGGNGIAGSTNQVAVVKRFACTSADAGKTIVATVAGLLASDNNSSVDFDSAWMESTTPQAFVVEKMPRFAYASPYLYVSAAQQAALNTDMAAVVAEFDSMVQIADIDTPWYSRSCTITNSTLNNTTAGTITGITITANGTDFAANVGTIITHNTEDMLLTAVSGSYPNYTISVTRQWRGSLVVHPSGTVCSDQTIMHTDNIHPNGYGHAIRAQVAFDTFNTVLATGAGQNYNLAMSAGNSSQDNRQPILGIANGSYYSSSINTYTNGTPALNTLYAHPIFIPQACFVSEIGVIVTAAGTATTGRVGIYDLDQTRSRPGGLIQEFGSFATTAIGFKSVASTWKFLRPGWYFLGYVNQGTTSSTHRCLGISTAASGTNGLNMVGYPMATASAPGTTFSGLVAFNATGCSGTLTSFNSGTFGTTYNETVSAVAPIVFLKLLAKHWS